QAVHLNPTRFDVLDRLVGRAPGGPPVDQGEVRVLRPPQLWRWRILPESVELPHPLLMHPVALRDVLGDAGEDVRDELAVLHVLVRRGDELISFHSGDRPGTHAALREEVSLELLHFSAVGGRHPAYDWHVEVRLFDRAVAFAQVEVGNQDDRRLVDFREVERLRGETEAFFGIATRTPCGCSCEAIQWRSDEPGFIGYCARNLTPAARAPRQIASFPVIRYFGSFGYASPRFREPPISSTAVAPSFAAAMFCCTIS